MSKKILLKRSSTVTDGSPKLPEADDMSYGELAINFADGYERISMKNSNNDIVELDVNVSSTLSDHMSDTDNPHSVTKSQIGLSDVDNTSDADKPVSALQQEALDDKLYRYSVDDEGDTTDENVANDTYGIVNNLTSTSTDKALSAYQGYLLTKELENATDGTTSDLTAMVERITALEEEVEDVLTYIGYEIDDDGDVETDSSGDYVVLDEGTLSNTIENLLDESV